MYFFFLAFFPFFFFFLSPFLPPFLLPPPPFPHYLVGVVGATATSLLKGRDLFVNKTWKALKHSGPPSSGEGGEGREEENEEEKKKNLMAALGCEEEGVEQVQKGLLPVRELGEDETHL